MLPDQQLSYNYHRTADAVDLEMIARTARDWLEICFPHASIHDIYETWVTRHRLV